ncbi:MAG TPA: type IV pilus assembly protein PilM [Patescibacteria group bacterium]
MFELFNGRKNHFIGIDFGTSSIKVVELSYKDQQAHLENYGTVDLNWAQQGEIAQDVKAQSYEQKLNEALKSLLVKMGLEAGNAYVSIPGFTGLITILELPDMREEELAKAIQFEAHKYIPSSLDEIAMSWEIIEHVGGNALENAPAQVQKKIRILLVAAPKREIERYDRLVGGTSLAVKAIELETFSIARSLIGDEAGTFIVIDIGSRATNILLVEKGIVSVNRNIDAGGNEITSAIADSMSISRQRAEDFKKGEKDLLNSKESAIVIPVLELISGETLRIINAYKEKNKTANIGTIILSGGTSNMKGIEAYFSRTLGSNVTLGNPWRRVMANDSIKPFIEKLGVAYSVALGLALRGVEEYKRQ